jgi:hypothetical protein
MLKNVLNAVLIEMLCSTIEGQTPRCMQKHITDRCVDRFLVHGIQSREIITLSAPAVVEKGANRVTTSSDQASTY